MKDQVESVYVSVHSSILFSAEEEMPAEETINLLTRLFNYIFAIPMLCMGMVGSIMIVIVFIEKRQFRRNTSLMYLLAGAIIIGIHLPTIYIQMILVYGFNVSLMNTNEAACREHTYLRYVTTVAAISFPCWASLDQYVSTSRNVAVRNRWSSRRLVRVVIICTVLFWTLFYIPIIFNTGIQHGVCTFLPNLYAKLNTYLFTPVVYGLGPVTIITWSTLGTVRNLRSKIVQNSRSRLTRQVRAMLMPQLLILAVSGIPFGFQGVYLDITSTMIKDGFQIAVENFIGQIILIFYHFNYVFIFYIYLYKSSEVRKALKEQFFKCMRKRIRNPSDATNDNPISLQTFKINTDNATQTA